MKKNVWVTLVSLGLIGALVGCNGVGQKETATSSPIPQVQKQEEAKSVEAKGSKLIGLADLVPHNDLMNEVKPILKEKGIEVEIVSTASDATWLDKLNNGEVDFAFFAHWPYVEEYNETNGAKIANVGNIHVEPIAAYSVKYTKTEEIPEHAKFIIPNDATNAYRALKIIEQAGFIKLDPNLKELKASVKDIIEYIKPIEIVEIDSIQIIGLAQDFDVYITNTNKALEAGVDTTKYLFREAADSPYANIVAVKEEKKDDPAIKALVEALRSDAIQTFIEEKYNGAVIPAK
ncbi:metal ABC transporter substrate-binding protein [Sporanaerobium hydrogeniformans]|uniref:Metal ABC transporter substrate-binding protein n=1 Tax=Sporanaerobium hydrogeniformans TaxID=3072179 RepID=A0AC61DB90_9FIRM|nr:MetQ/NlpA family ABC transporter substrate-binding protein [Sporanaerobium hydrogeniformans]PHV70534.1 metal ABC transporter substrate-binding protein [Sporanaerobium hydrogeniformans]